MHQERNFKARTYIRILQITFVQGPANAELFEGLLMLQHRGQDSAGMVTYDGGRFCEHKDNGLVNDVFTPKTMKQLRGGLQCCWVWSLLPSPVYRM